MESVQKFKDLKINNTYCVIGFSDPIKSKFGTSYILEIVDDKDDFEIWSTKSLAQNISTENPIKQI